MTDLTKLKPKELYDRIWNNPPPPGSEHYEIFHRLERLEQCEALLQQVDSLAAVIDVEWPNSALMSRRLAKAVGDFRVAARAALEEPKEKPKPSSSTCCGGVGCNVCEPRGPY